MKSEIAKLYGIDRNLELGLSPQIIRETFDSPDEKEMLRRKSITDYYGLLGLANNVSTSRIEQRVRGMQKAVDYLTMQKLGLAPHLVNSAKREYELIEKAGKVLLDRKSRLAYDEVLSQANKQLINTDGIPKIDPFEELEKWKVEEVKYLIVIAEGSSDIAFLKNINKLPEIKSIFDFDKSESVFLPLGGSSIKFFAENGIFDKMCFPTFYLFDSDIGSTCPFKYQDLVNKINDKQDKCEFATQTKLRQLENYIPIDIIRKGFNLKDFNPEITPSLDVSEAIAISLEHLSQEQWKKLSKFERNARINEIKTRISYELTKKITASSLKETGVFDEITSWYKKMAELYSYFE